MDATTKTRRAFVVTTGLPIELHAEPRQTRRDDRDRQKERRAGAPGDVRGRIGIRQVIAVDEETDAPGGADFERLFDAHVEQDDVVLPAAADRLGQYPLRAVIDPVGGAG